MTILPSTYLPSVEHFAHILRGDYIIDIGEHFQKRSARNRATIMTANGLMQLTVNVCRANRPRTPMKSMEIDYSKRWQHQHWMAIVSAYKSSPFFDHYADYLEPLYAAEWGSLVEFNIALTELILKLVGQPAKLKISESYVDAAEGDLDLRGKDAECSVVRFEPYVQVFADRHPFAENLSVLDLLFNEGPNSICVALQGGEI